MFAYCCNNSVNFSDSPGMRPVSILERECCDSIAVPPKSNPTKIDPNPQQSTTASLSATSSCGYSGYLNIGSAIYGVQCFITFDTNGYMAIQYAWYSGFSLSPYATDAAIGCSPVILLTNAPSYEGLENNGLSIGTSLTNCSVDYIGALADDGKTINYHGLAIGLPGACIGKASSNAHITFSNTKTFLAVPFDRDTFYKITQY